MSDGNALAISILWPVAIWCLGLAIANTETWLEQRRRARPAEKGGRT